MYVVESLRVCAALALSFFTNERFVGVFARSSSWEEKGRRKKTTTSLSLFFFSLSFLFSHSLDSLSLSLSLSLFLPSFLSLSLSPLSPHSFPDRYIRDLQIRARDLLCFVRSIFRYKIHSTLKQLVRRSCYIYIYIKVNDASARTEVILGTFFRGFGAKSFVLSTRLTPPPIVRAGTKGRRKRSVYILWDRTMAYAYLFKYIIIGDTGT